MVVSKKREAGVSKKHRKGKKRCDDRLRLYRDRQATLQPTEEINLCFRFIIAKLFALLCKSRDVLIALHRRT